jgi:hypothetical protein
MEQLNFAMSGHARDGKSGFKKLMVCQDGSILTFLE